MLESEIPNLSTPYIISNAVGIKKSNKDSTLHWKLGEAVGFSAQTAQSRAWKIYLQSFLIPCAWVVGLVLADYRWLLMMCWAEGLWCLYSSHGPWVGAESSQHILVSERQWYSIILLITGCKMGYDAKLYNVHLHCTFTCKCTMLQIVLDESVKIIFLKLHEVAHLQQKQDKERFKKNIAN